MTFSGIREYTVLAATTDLMKLRLDIEQFT
jgi:hypothetical protein